MPCTVCGRTWMQHETRDHAYTEGEYQTASIAAPISGGAPSGGAALASALLPLVVQGFKQLIDLYNTLINHPETPEALQAKYAEVTAQVGATEIAVTDIIRQVRGEE